MGLKKGVSLYSIYLKSISRKIWFDLIREIVIGICSGILILLFIYIFQDFINVKLAAVSPQAQEKFAKGFSILLLSIAAVFIVKTLKNWKFAHESLERICYRLGEDPSTIRAFTFLKVFVLEVAVFGVTSFVILKYIYTPSLAEGAWSILVSILASLTGIFYKSSPRNEKTYKSMTMKGRSKYRHLIRWRLYQMFFRNRVTRLCALVALVMSGLVGISGVAQSTFAITVILSLLAGFVMSGTLIFQAQDDMTHSWLEKQCGVSHNQIMNTYLLIGILIGFFFSTLNFLFYTANDLFQGTFDTQSLKLIPITWLPLLTFSSVVFQVDPTRPGIQLITNFILSLFLGTAIFAHGLTVILIPIAIYYSIKYQEDAFYQT